MAWGSLLIAARTTGKTGFRIALNPAYADVAIERWQQFIDANFGCSAPVMVNCDTVVNADRCQIPVSAAHSDRSEFFNAAVMLARKSGGRMFMALVMAARSCRAACS